MSIESATFISQLVATNPVGTDDRSTIDDHARLLKSVLQGQFPNFTAIAMNASCVELNLLVGLTSTAAEINTLDGYTGTVTDFNALVTANAAGTLLTTADEGAGNGLDADTVDGNEAATLLARANHTGTQAASTISGQFAISQFPAVVADTTHYGQTSAGSTSSTGMVKLTEAIFTGAGTVSVRFTLKSDGATSQTMSGQIYVNGLAVGTLRSNDGTETAYTETITVANGDLIQIYGKTTNAAVICIVSEFSLGFTGIAGVLHSL